MLNSLGGFEIGVELWVQRAENSKLLLLEMWKLCTMYRYYSSYLVDLWTQKVNYKDVGA